MNPSSHPQPAGRPVPAKVQAALKTEFGNLISGASCLPFSFLEPFPSGLVVYGSNHSTRGFLTNGKPGAQPTNSTARNGNE